MARSVPLQFQWIIKCADWCLKSWAKWKKSAGTVVCFWRCSSLAPGSRSLLNSWCGFSADPVRQYKSSVCTHSMVFMTLMSAAEVYLYSSYSFHGVHVWQQVWLYSQYDFHDACVWQHKSKCTHNMVSMMLISSSRSLLIVLMIWFPWCSCLAANV